MRSHIENSSQIRFMTQSTMPITGQNRLISQREFENGSYVAFKSMQQAQRFLRVHATVYNLFNLGRHVVSAKNYRFFRLRAFVSWNHGAAL